MSNKSISPTELATALQAENPPTVFDVRKKPAFLEAPELIPGATWQIHDDVENWAGDLPRDQPVIVYCVYGHEVGKNAAQALRDMGLDACYLEGGIEDWKIAGLAVVKGKE